MRNLKIGAGSMVMAVALENPSYPPDYASVPWNVFSVFKPSDPGRQRRRDELLCL